MTEHDVIRHVTGVMSWIRGIMSMMLSVVPYMNFTHKLGIMRHGHMHGHTAHWAEELAPEQAHPATTRRHIHHAACATAIRRTVHVYIKPHRRVEARSRTKKVVRRWAWMRKK